MVLGGEQARGCIDCGQCSKTFRCAFSDDVCNDLIEAILKADGIIIGSPVYFAAPSGALCALLDRVFYAASTHGGLFKGKPAAAVASCIRSGANSTVDRINKYFSFSEMPIVSSSYWNMLFDSHSPIGFDERGHKTMQTLGYNMAAILQNTLDHIRMEYAESWREKVFGFFSPTLFLYICIRQELFDRNTPHIAEFATVSKSLPRS